MAYTTIDDPSAHFTTTLYTGNAVDDRAITNSANAGNFQPDLLWYKERTSTSSHRIFDSSRGASKRVEPDVTAAEATDTSNHKSFDTNGYTIGTSGSTNADGDTYIAWQWKANAGTSNASAAESGSNVAYNFQVNTTSKFMINAYTGTGSSQTLNLGNHFTPQFLMIKNRSEADAWAVYHHKMSADPDTDFMVLNVTDAVADDATYWEDVNFAADEINLGTNHSVGADGENYICYSWAGVQGYSKFGSFTGNGNDNGPFIYTGFSPSFVMIRRTNNSGGWLMFSDGLHPHNEHTSRLHAEVANAQQTHVYYQLDMLSNGFKIPEEGDNMNGDGDTMIYIAFAKQPFVTSEGVPATAR